MQGIGIACIAALDSMLYPDDIPELLFLGDMILDVREIVICRMALITENSL